MPDLTTQEAKDWGKIDDDTIIVSLILVSKELIKNATGKTGDELVKINDSTTIKISESETYKLCQKIIITDLNENRESKNLTQKTQTILDSLYLQFKYCYEVSE